ncbi:MAG: hypothetical protein ACREBU_26870, partial [Nitrososphaera sp.]
LRRMVRIREHYFGYYDVDDDEIHVGLFRNRKHGQADELVYTVIHEALHKVRPDWPEDVVQMEEARYAKSRVLRETALVKILNVTLFGRDLDSIAKGKANANHQNGSKNPGEDGSHLHEEDRQSSQGHEEGPTGLLCDGASGATNAQSIQEDRA